ncbi:FkbM family methyltransferase [Vibrio cortegadensis]|uniref:FkbM family methyltransferase n=1 Tax=Vibrio cortegadensis TaxID=1328770 RepID=A0ABV4M714_9VIBR
MKKKIRIKKALQYFGVPAVIDSIKAQYFGGSELFSIKLDYLEHPLSLRLLGSDVPTFKKIFIEQEYDFHTNIPPKVIVDAGANVGFTSVYLANKFPECKIISIEPEAENFEVLKLNTKPYKNIVAIQAALWNENKKINLVDPGKGSWGFTAEDSDDNDADLIDAVTVDYLLEHYKLGHIDILKIDIEGSEKEVFDDTSKWLSNVNSIVIELHERMKQGCNRSFYTGTPGFNVEWQKGENVFIARDEEVMSPR